MTDIQPSWIDFQMLVIGKMSQKRCSKDNCFLSTIQLHAWKNLKLILQINLNLNKESLPQAKCWRWAAGLWQSSWDTCSRGRVRFVQKFDGNENYDSLFRICLQKCREMSPFRDENVSLVLILKEVTLWKYHK